MKKSSGQRQFLAVLAKTEDAELLRQIRQHPEIASDPATLVLASLHGRKNVVRALLQQGADPNAIAPSHEKYRPLHRAIEHRGIPKNKGHLETVKILLEAGADPETRSTWMGLTALTVAGMAGDPEMIECLLQDKSSLNIFEASILADSPRVKALLKKDRKLALKQDSNHMTALHYAALSGLNKVPEQKRFAAIAVLLTEAGGDLNSKPQIGPYPETPILHFAAWSQNLAVARVLLEKGADPNLGFGNCLWREPGDLGNLFVQYGADLNGCELSGKPFLHSRIHWNLTTVVKWMLEKGADPNLRDFAGNTPLHEAARRSGNLKMVELLLSHGAKKNLKNKAGESVADLARRQKRADFLEKISAS